MLHLYKEKVLSGSCMLCAVLTHLLVKTSFSTKRDPLTMIILSDFFSRGYERVLLWNLENDVFLRTAQGMTRVRSIKMESMGESDVTECKLHFGKLILQGLLIHSAGFVFDRAKKLQGSVRTTCSFSSVSLLTSQGCVPVLS